MQTDYIFKKDGKEEIVKLERWVWGVIFHPTETQVAEAAEKKRLRDEEIDRDTKERERLLRERGDVDEQTIADMKVFQGKKKQIPVEPECSEFHQFDSEGFFHQIGEVDQSRVKALVVYKPDDKTKRIYMPLADGMKIIFKYKMVKPWYLKDFVRVICFGYKAGSTHHFTFILPDDRMIISNQEDIDLVQYRLT
jgi:hypothetical protein